MRRARSRAAGALAALLVASTAVASTKTVKLELKLSGKPVVPRPELSALLTAGPLTLQVNDARGADDPAAVGVLREKGSDVYTWRAAEPVGPAVATMVAAILSDWSVRTAPEAQIVLKLDLTKLFVTERSETFGSNYVAEVQFKGTLSDRSGAVLWTGEASGEAKRAGVDGRASMYNEALGIALQRALAQSLASVTDASPQKAAAAPPANEPPPPPVIEPAALLADLTRLKSGGVADEVLVAYIEQRRLSRPLTVDEILAWKNAGIPDAAIKAATK